jgi:translation initiation factor IF-1
VAAAVVAVVTATDNRDLLWPGDVPNERRPASFRGSNFYRRAVSFLAEFFQFMEEHIEVEGRIMTVLAGTMFRVELDNKHQVLATISGKMRKRFVRLTVGDRVKMQMSQYDLNKARIVWRIG